MGRIEKLIERFKKQPKDFTYDEMVALMKYFGYNENNKGKTSGSRVRFKNEETGSYVDIHKPHPTKIMKSWMMREIKAHLLKQKYI